MSPRSSPKGIYAACHERLQVQNPFWICWERRSKVPSSHWTLWLWASVTEFPALQELAKDCDCDNIKQTVFPLLSALPRICCYSSVTLLSSTSLPRGFLKFSNTFWGRNIKLSVIRTPFRPFVFWIKLFICKTEVNLPFYEGSGAEEQLSCLTPRLSLFKGLQVSRYHITFSPKVSVRSRQGHLRTSRRFLISNKRCCSLSVIQSSWKKHVASPAGHADVDIWDWNL